MDEFQRIVDALDCGDKSYKNLCWIALARIYILLGEYRRATEGNRFSHLGFNRKIKINKKKKRKSFISRSACEIPFAAGPPKSGPSLALSSAAGICLDKLAHSSLMIFLSLSLSSLWFESDGRYNIRPHELLHSFAPVREPIRWIPPAASALPFPTTALWAARASTRASTMSISFFPSPSSPTKVEEESSFILIDFPCPPR